MRTTKQRTASGIVPRIIVGIFASLLIATEVESAVIDAGEPATLAKAETNKTASQDTNSPVSQIQTNLDTIKAQIAASVKRIQEAVTSTPAQQAQKVSALAAEIRNLATKDLADDSQIVKGADALIEKMKGQVSHARAASSDPKIGAREIYAAVLTKLEPELGRLVDSRAAVTRVRAALVEKADALDASATAIGFAADADQAIVAAIAFRDTLSDAVAFARKIEMLIDDMGKKQIAT